MSTNGVLVVDKPGGLTSHDVVAVARRALGETRIGHTGTLDPLATGVLPLACGQATRLVRFLSASDKDYDATIRFGLVTDSYDTAGTAVRETDARPTREAVERALESLRGDYLQTPPPYSAKKVGGRRAYDLARRDQPVELTPVPVRVSRAELTAFSPESASVAITCSAGFYVRTLAHTLGERVGTGACLSALRRTRSGQFTLADAVGMSALAGGAAAGDGVLAALIPLERLLTGLPAVRVTADGRARVSHGQPLGPSDVVGQPAPGDAPAPTTGRSSPESGESWIRILDPDGLLIAVAQPRGLSGALHPAIVLI